MKIFTHRKKRNRVSFFKTVLFLIICFSFNKAYSSCTNYDTLVILHDTTWNTTLPISFGGGPIIIKGGVTFTLINVILYFNQSGGIISDPHDSIHATHLVIENSLLTKCPSSWYWAGISITGVQDSHGNYSEYQDIGGVISMNLSGQSSVKIFGSEIEDAYCGVKVLRHAIVQISDNSSFFDCLTGVLVNPSGPDPLTAAILLQNPVYSASFLDSVTFEVDGGLNTLASNLSSYRDVQLIGTSYFEIKGCTFKCTDPLADSSFKRTTGIYAIDANFACHSTTGFLDPVTRCIAYSSGTKTKCTFQNLSYGIYYTSDSFKNTIYVDDCKMTNCFVAAYLKGGNHHVFHSNNFSLVTNGIWPWLAEADTVHNNFVSFINAPNFLFYGNVLKENKINTKFLYIKGCGTDQKNITLDSFINTKTPPIAYGDNEYGIFFEGDNRNQFVTCNGFTNHVYGIFIDSNALVSNFGSAGYGVGNKFTSMAPPPGYDVFTNTTIYTGLTYTTEFSVNLGPFITPAFTSDYCRYVDDCRRWALGLEPWNNGTGFNIKIYPNPAGSQIIFDFSDISGLRNGSKISINDAIGRLISTNMLTNNESQVTINTEGYADGVYLYHIIINDTMEKTGKFEIRH